MQASGGRSLAEVDRLPEWPRIMGFPMRELGNFMKTLTCANRKIASSRRGSPLRIIDGANITKEIMRARNPSLRANPIITPGDLTVFEEIERDLDFDFLVVNASIISQNEKGVPLPPYVQRLITDGRLLQISCSETLQKQKADDYLCMYLGLAFGGIVITGDYHSDHCKNYGHFVSRLRYGLIEEDPRRGFMLVSRTSRPSKTPGVVLAQVDRLPSYASLASGPASGLASGLASGPASGPAHVTCAFCSKVGHGARSCPTWRPKS